MSLGLTHGRMRSGVLVALVGFGWLAINPMSGQAQAVTPSASDATHGHAKAADNDPKPNPDSALTIVELTPGTGPETVNGARLKVHYTGWLYDAKAPHGLGSKFDSSLDRKQPIEFVLGAHQVIPGWEAGMQGLKVGGRRRLFIAPELAYGERGAGGVIPPNAMLVFDVQLVAVEAL